MLSRRRNFTKEQFRHVSKTAPNASPPSPPISSFECFSALSSVHQPQTLHPGPLPPASNSTPITVTATGNLPYLPPSTCAPNAPPYPQQARIVGAQRKRDEPHARTWLSGPGRTHKSDLLRSFTLYRPHGFGSVIHFHSLSVVHSQSPFLSSACTHCIKRATFVARSAT